MDDLELKLNSNNTVLITRTISTLLDTIKQKSADQNAKKSKYELKEIHFLKEKCVSSNPLVCLTASAGLVKLVQHGTIPLQLAISDLIALLGNAK